MPERWSPSRFAFELLVGMEAFLGLLITLYCFVDLDSLHQHLMYFCIIWSNLFTTILGFAWHYDSITGYHRLFFYVMAPTIPNVNVLNLSGVYCLIQFNSIQFFILRLFTFKVILDNTKKSTTNYSEQINTLAMSKMIGLCKIIKISFVESSMLCYCLIYLLYFPVLWSVNFIHTGARTPQYHTVIDNDGTPFLSSISFSLPFSFL
jgi:hypothetical protein